MDDVARKQILQLLEGAIEAIKNEDAFMLKQISTEHINQLPIFQDEDYLSISVAIYALSKILERSDSKKDIIARLSLALSALEKNDESKYRKTVQGLVSSIRANDAKFKRYIFSIIENVSVRKGIDLYAKGLSLGHVASILGVSRWELLRTVGRTTISENSLELIPTEQRLDLARRIFL